MIHLTTDKRMLEYSSMKPYSNIFCFSTTRHGGYSSGEYASFNCNSFCGDNPAAVEENRKLLCRLMPEQPRRLIIPHQTHQTETRIVDEGFLSHPEEEQRQLLEGIDALTTDCKGVCICVSTADCVPILYYDTRQQAIAAIHAGWRGSVSRIVTRTLQVMRDAYGTRGEDLVACIGPSISPDAFEVGDEVYERFRSEGFDMDCIAIRREKWHINLWEANRFQLLEAGVQSENIELTGICTWMNVGDFFSARRQGIASGRILSGIMLM